MAQSAENNANQELNMNMNLAKSRRDDTLLTVGFNLRKDAARHVSTLVLCTKCEASPVGTTYCALLCRPCGTWCACVYLPVRRLKSTVIRMLSPLGRASLRDFTAPSLWEICNILPLIRINSLENIKSNINNEYQT